MPASPSSSRATYKARLYAAFEGADPRVCAAFWLFGLINNVLYVIILSAALDLVGPSIPKGVVLLADVVPSFLTKLVAPYFIHIIPYRIRIVVLVVLSICGMLLIALSPPTRDSGTIVTKLLGIMLASLSSGLGELSFLGLTHFYGHFSLAAWGSGTGGAGLIGAGAYVIATTTMGRTVRTTLLTFSFLPLIMVVTFFVILPREAILDSKSKPTEYTRVEVDEPEAESENTENTESALLDYEGPSSTIPAPPFPNANQPPNTLSEFKANLRRARKLFIPYMLPLLLVYIAEYTINQGISPTLLYPLPQTPFTHYRDFYPTYNAIYQTGVFLSRSSTPFIRIHTLYAPTILQIINLAILTSHALFNFIPSVYLLFVVFFWEGILGGAVYVNTFAEITDRVDVSDREFSLAATSVSDSAGICIAGVLGAVLEGWVCSWQVRHGRDYCRRV